MRYYNIIGRNNPVYRTRLQSVYIYPIEETGVIIRPVGYIVDSSSDLTGTYFI